MPRTLTRPQQNAALRRALEELARKQLANEQVAPFDPQLEDYQQAPPGEWRTRLFVAGRMAGKALAWSTPIITPNGWTTIGEISPGDTVFDEQGQPCTVTATFQPTPERVYRVTFNDGTSLVACGEHQWTTWDHAARKAFLRSRHEPDRTRMPDDWPTWRPASQHWAHDQPARNPDGPGPRTINTDQLAATLTTGPRHDRNHCIPTAGPLDMPTVDLPVDPYLLGYWLGDGSSWYREITCSAGDLAHVTGHIDHELVRHPKDRPPEVRLHSGVWEAMKALDLRGNKHIPDMFLWADADQRLALLQGLMDSDGHISPRNRTVEFSTTDPGLADSVVFLARTLGQKPKLAKGRATLDGVDCGPKYRVTWYPTAPVFRMERKADLIAPKFRAHHRMVVACDPVPLQPVKCLTVDSPNSLFLAGEAMIPTHNTYAGSRWAAWKAVVDCPGGEGCLAAPTFQVARDVMVEGPSGILAALGDRLRNYNRSTLEIWTTTGSKIHVRSAEKPETMRGLNLSWFWADEIGSWPDPKGERGSSAAWHDGLQLSLRIGDLPQGMVTTTPRRTGLMVQLWDEAHDETIPATVIQKATAFDNPHIAESVKDQMRRMYEGTDRGLQELYGELILDVEGAIWKLSDIVRAEQVEPDYDHAIHLAGGMQKIIIAVDPSSQADGLGDDFGIVVVGRDRRGFGYVLDDLSLRGGDATYKLDEDRGEKLKGPAHGVQRVADAFHREYMSGRYTPSEIVIEGSGNIGGYAKELFGRVAPNLPLTFVYPQASKSDRARSVLPLWQNGTIRHVGPKPLLEDEMTTWEPEESKWSPNRIDAVVHGVAHLFPPHEWTAGQTWEDKRSSRRGR